MLGCIDMNGHRQLVGPVHASTECHVVKEAAAALKGVASFSVSLVHNTKCLQDGHTLGSSGIRKEQDIKVIITPLETWDHFCETFTAWLMGAELRISCQCHWCRTWRGMEEVRHARAWMGRMEEVD